MKYLSNGVVWSGKEISTNFAVVNQDTESYDNDTAIRGVLGTLSTRGSAQ